MVYLCLFYSKKSMRNLCLILVQILSISGHTFDIATHISSSTTSSLSPFLVFRFAKMENPVLHRYIMENWSKITDAFSPC